MVEVAPPRLTLHVLDGKLCWETTVGGRYDVLSSATPAGDWAVVEFGFLGTGGKICLTVAVAERPDVWRVIRPH